jgi:hypothetical protein
MKEIDSFNKNIKEYIEMCEIFFKKIEENVIDKNQEDIEKIKSLLISKLIE